MRLINLEGSAIFGPGSEWFWSMAQFALVAVTLIGIYHQLRLARNANAFEHMSRLGDDWASERMIRYMLEILNSRRGGAKAEDAPGGAVRFIADYWEQVALLVRAGHVDRTLVYGLMSGACGYWWALLAPSIRRDRVDDQEPRLYEHFEWLAGIMTATAARAGVESNFDDAYLAGTLDPIISGCLDQIRVEEALRR